MQYVSLHNHTTFSIYDGLGTPKEFFDYVLQSGGDGLAITEHGSCNSLGYAVSAAKDLQKKQTRFRAIYGVEAYILPSLEHWRNLHNQDDADNALVIENESESKGKWYDPIKRRHHLVIFALTNSGLQNLFRLVSLSYRRENFYRFPRMDFDMLRQYNDGLAISTACLAGLPTWCSLHDKDANDEHVMALYDKELLPLLEIFGRDRAFLELQFNALPEQAIVNHHLVQYAQRTKYNLVVASDAHYCRPELWREREIYRSLGRQMMQSGADIAAIPKNIEDLKCELYPHNADQIYAAYCKYFRCHNTAGDQLVIDAINRTHDIAWQLVGDVKPDSTIKLPKFVPLSDTIKTPFQQLAKLCQEALVRKGLTEKCYIQRTLYELEVIKEKDVAAYFLTKKAILDALRKHMLLGTGRGSGAGSLVNYLLDITLADPIKGGLLFERFMSPSRAELPDIDSDCEDKDQAYEILKAEFGEDNVLAISNYNTLKLKSLIKDVARLYGISFDEANKVTKVIEDEARDPIMAEIGQDQKLYELTFEKAFKYSASFKAFICQYPHVGECLATLYKSVKSIGRHAGGVLVVPDASKHLPIIRVRNVSQSPFTEGLTAQHLKHFGLVKFDVLGLATLKIIRRCIELVLKKQGNPSPSTQDVWDYYNTHLHPDVIDPADQQVFDNVYCAGRFPSIFQFAERNVQEFCKRARPRHLKDIAVITSLWRPGPLGGQADKRYIENTNNKIVYEHPILQELLAESRGILVFQEQFMLLANKLAGFSLDDADKLRKLLVKPSHELGEEMREQRAQAGIKFIDGCVAKGLSRERAKRLWNDEILGFISYGFNKSHAHVYAYNSYQCAWLFTHHETEWIKACLEKDPDLEKTIASVSQLGYTVSKPDVNYSLADEWQIADKRCIPPMVAIKNIGTTAAQELERIRTQPFESFSDFLYNTDEHGHQRWRWSKLNKKALEALVQLEAFDSLNCVGNDALFKNYHHMHHVLFSNFDKVRKAVTKEGRGKKAVITNLNLYDLPGREDQIEDWPTAQKIAMQKELTGTFDKNLLFSPHVLTLIQKYDIKSLADISEEKPEPVWFFVSDIKVHQTARGKPYFRLSINDGHGISLYLNVFDEIEHSPINKVCVGKLMRNGQWLNIEGRLHCLA